MFLPSLGFEPGKSKKDDYYPTHGDTTVPGALYVQNII